MIVLDTETTGITKPDASPIDKQPQIIELAAIKISDKTLKEQGRFDTLINPQCSLPPIITEITGITDADLQGQPNFADALIGFKEFCLGEKIWVAHNVMFDFNMIRFELERLDQQFNFPYPLRYVCTSEGTKFLNNGSRLKLGALYELLTGKKLENAHRAMNDVEGLVRCVKELRKQHEFI